MNGVLSGALCRQQFFVMIIALNKNSLRNEQNSLQKVERDVKLIKVT